MNTSIKHQHRHLLRRLGWLPLVLLGAALFATGPQRSGVHAEDPKRPSPLMADLNYISPDHPAFISVRLADLWNGPLGKEVRKLAGKDLDNVVKEIEKEIGTAPADIERLTLVMTEIPIRDQVMVVRTVKPIDREKLVAAIVPGAKEEKAKGQTYHVSP